VNHDLCGLHNFLDLFKQLAKISVRCRAIVRNVHRVDPARIQDGRRPHLSRSRDRSPVFRFMIKTRRLLPMFGAIA